MSIDWNDGRIADLKTRWAEGQSGGVIAVEMLGHRRHKNAVIGMVHRLGFRKSDNAERITLPPKKRVSRRLNQMLLRRAFREAEQRAAPSPAPITEPILNLPPDQSSFAVKLVEAKEDQCRYPLDEPTHNMKVCGAPKQSGSYCARHAARCYA